MRTENEHVGDRTTDGSLEVWGSFVCGQLCLRLLRRL